jgi:hypothetical protein
VTSWLGRRKAWLAIVVPYVALGIASAAAIGVYSTRADQAQVRSEQAEVRADLANNRAALALELQAASCLDRKQAQQDTDQILLTIAAALPPSVRATLTALVSARPLITC